MTEKPTTTPKTAPAKLPEIPWYWYNWDHRVKPWESKSVVDQDMEVYGNAMFWWWHSGRLDAAARTLSKKLQDTIEKHSFANMRALFLQYMVQASQPKNLAEATAIVAVLPCWPGDPGDAVIESLSDAKVVPLLKAIKATQIHKLRNDVVHKKAYRPTREEVDAALQETRSILFPLTTHLDLHDEINWYLRKRQV